MSNTLMVFQDRLKELTITPEGGVLIDQGKNYIQVQLKELIRYMELPSFPQLQYSVFMR